MEDASDQPVVYVAVVGHLDHGKSTLIGRLRHDLGGQCGPVMDWAFVTDQLQEEQTGGLTLETTQTAIEVGNRRLVFIDVPGHRELIRNMLTGATRAEAAVLVVAADEGLRVQSCRHAALLSLLGITRVIVAINKLDLASDQERRFGELARQARDLLTATGLTTLAVVPVGARTGEGLLQAAPAWPWYTGQPLLAELLAIPPPDAVAGPARFVVQDVYADDGAQVAAGRLLSGCIAAGHHLMRLPAGETVTVLNVRRFPLDARPVVAGESAALVTTGASPRRGDVLAAPGGLPLVTDHLRGRVFWLAEEPLKVGDELGLRLATQSVLAHVQAITDRLDTGALASLPDAEYLEATQMASVRLYLSQPTVLEPFTQMPGLGRFILERAGCPVAAGIVPADSAEGC